LARFSARRVVIASSIASGLDPYLIQISALPAQVHSRDRNPEWVSIPRGIVMLGGTSS